MDFQLSEDQLTTQKWVHEFAEKEIRPVAAQYDETEEFPWPVLNKAAEIGLYSAEFYIETVAGDPTGLMLPIAMEETCWGCSGISLGIWGSGLPLSTLAYSGTPDQVMKWAPVMFGTPEEPKVGALCVTESNAGSDVSALRTTARRDGEEWVLNGQKIFITNGGVASVFVVVATVDPSLGHRGQAAFVVGPDTPGIRPGKKERKLGIRASDTSEVLLEDCRIPVENVVGGVEKLEAKLEHARANGAAKGRSAALKTFEMTRPLVAAQAIGIARAAYEFSLEYAKQREAFGRPIIENQGIAFKLADMAMEIDAARLLTYRAAWLARNGTLDHAEGSMSKLKAGEVAVWVTEQAVQILGGYGYIKDFPVEKWYRDAKIYTIFEGTSEIQRIVISRALAQS
jgi:acyl-CoA dehydrogenase